VTVDYAKGCQQPVSAAVPSSFMYGYMEIEIVTICEQYSKMPGQLCPELFAVVAAPVGLARVETFVWGRGAISSQRGSKAARERVRMLSVEKRGGKNKTKNELGNRKRRRRVENAMDHGR